MMDLKLATGLALPLVLWFATTSQVWAQNMAKPATPVGTQSGVITGTMASPKAPAVGKTTFSKPAWNELTPVQQQALKPLAASWDSKVNEGQKRKWLEISKSYAALPPEDQGKMHSRMNEWIALSPEQRAQARLNFATTNELSRQLTPEEKKAKWQTYQSLSPEEKAKLAEKATPKPAGAATAVKPVAPQKLAPVPPHSVSKPSAGAASKIVPNEVKASVQPANPAVPGASLPAIKN